MKIMIALVITLIGTMASSSYAGRHTIDIDATELTTHSVTASGLGDYFVLEFVPPSGIAAGNLKHAMLEVFVDVSARTVNGYVEKTPRLEVYALKGAISTSLDPGQFEVQTLPSIRNVTLRDSKRVVVDITEIVRGLLESPSKNYGIVIGALTGARAGLFTVRSDKLGAGASVRITFFD